MTVAVEANGEFFLDARGAGTWILHFRDLFDSHLNRSFTVGSGEHSDLVLSYETGQHSIQFLDHEDLPLAFHSVFLSPGAGEDTRAGIAAVTDADGRVFLDAFSRGRCGWRVHSDRGIVLGQGEVLISGVPNQVRIPPTRELKLSLRHGRQLLEHIDVSVFHDTSQLQNRIVVRKREIRLRVSSGALMVCAAGRDVAAAEVIPAGDHDVSLVLELAPSSWLSIPSGLHVDRMTRLAGGNAITLARSHWHCFDSRIPEGTWRIVGSHAGSPFQQTVEARDALPVRVSDW
ncbi:MAG: hypothetical protein AAF581_01935 [Planctomycetota bacterium]